MRKTSMKILALAAVALSATAASASNDPPARAETRVPDMARFIEWVADGEQGVFIRAYNGRWYYARTENACPRLASTQALRFVAAPNGDLDRYGAIVAEGWRCRLGSVVRSDGPPNRR